MCAMSDDECLDRLCRTLWSVASCHQFRTLPKGRNTGLAIRPGIWREHQQLHLRGLG